VNTSLIKHLTALALTLSLTLVSTSLMAEDEEEPKYGWSGKGEFGLVSTTGNSDTFSYNLGLKFEYNSEQWRHRLAASALSSEDDGEKTAQRFELGAQSDYKMTEKSYVFGALRYDNDDFSAYKDQATASVGYGRQILDSKTQQLRMEAGVGYRTATVAETDETENGMIFRGMLDWGWQITESTKLGDRFLIEAGSDNTYMQNDLGLTVAINSRFALGVAFQVRHNSDVPPGVDKTDTQTSVNLVYNFGQ